MPHQLTNSNASTTSPLQFLAHVALDVHHIPRSDGPGSTCSVDRNPMTILQSQLPRNASTTLHIDCGQSTSSSPIAPKPLKRSSTSNSLHSSESSAESGRCPKPKKHTRKSSRLLLKARADIKARRREYMTRVLKIKTLDNSPVNDQQYAILRTVYDEITMYPSEAWMVLIALIIHRSLKQVKNWFSNERQKQKTGEVVSIQSDIGEKVRLRPSILQLCQEWSDGLFEGIIRVYHFKITHSS